MSLENLITYGFGTYLIFLAALLVSLLALNKQTRMDSFLASVYSFLAVLLLLSGIVLIRRMEAPSLIATIMITAAIAFGAVKIRLSTPKIFATT